MNSEESKIKHEALELLACMQVQKIIRLMVKGEPHISRLLKDKNGIVIMQAMSAYILGDIHCNGLQISDQEMMLDSFDKLPQEMKSMFSEELIDSLSK